MNTVCISGNLTKDPKLRYSANSTAFATLGLAVNRPKNKNTGEVVTDFFDVVCFGAIAELCANSLKKGNKASVFGKLQSRSYTDKNGVKRKSIEIVAYSVDFYTLPKAAQTTAAPIDLKPSDVFIGPDVTDEDLPFF